MAIILRIVIAFGAIAMLAVSHPGRAEEAPLSPTAWAALLDRRTVDIEEASSRDGVPGVRARFAVVAPRDRAWDALVDYANFTKIFRGIERADVLEQDARHAVVELWVQGEIGSLHYVLERRYERPGHRLSWRRLSGDLERIEGSWEIRDTPRAGTLLLVYESYAEIGWFVPTPLYLWLAKRRTAEMANALRGWVEAGTTESEQIRPLQ